MTAHVTNKSKQNIRTLSSYKSLLSIKSKSTEKLFQCTINNVEKFGKIDIRNLSQYDEDEMYDLLQDWIIWNAGRNITSSSMMCYFNIFQTYLWYHKIKLDHRDVRHHIKFPQALHEDQIPITTDNIKNILRISKLEFRFQLLALISSGMRVGELGQIRFKHLDLTHSNIIIRIPSHITKTGHSRIAFFSKQVSEMIRYRMKKQKLDDGFVFCGDRTPEQSRNLILKRFGAAREKADLMEKYGHCKQNRYVIHVHSLRSYFITKTNRVQFGLGHILAGHDFYMREYNQYSIIELLSMYKKAEKNLTF